MMTSFQDTLVRKKKLFLKSLIPNGIVYFSIFFQIVNPFIDYLFQSKNKRQ